VQRERRSAALMRRTHSRVESLSSARELFTCRDRADKVIEQEGFVALHECVGTKLTFRGQPSLPAFEGKADLDETCGNVR
jgi:hypothetical protein